MSLTAAAWLLAFATLAYLSTKRAVWAFGLYWLTYYASPPFWWWGDPINAITMRWSFTAATICVVAVLLHPKPKLTPREKTGLLLFGVYVLNATLVHFMLASNPERSYVCLTHLWKYAGLFMVGLLGIRDRRDLELALWFIVIMSFYIGYEVVVHDRGQWVHGRLELKVIPQAGEANALAGLLAMALPIGAAFLLGGQQPLWKKAGLVVVLVFLFETILRCNSRSVFLSLLAAGPVWLLLAKGKARKRALVGLCLVAMAVPLMVKSEKIVNRFKSTFVEEDERDGSASARIVMWKAAVEMIKGHPFGSGGESAFRSPLGNSYIAHLGIGLNRAVHNGFLDIATGWGIQGLAIYLAIAGMAAWSLYRGIALSWHGDLQWRLIGAALVADVIIIFVCATFASTLDNEWMIWWFFLSFAYGRISQQEAHQRNAIASHSFSEQAAARVVPELVPAG